MVGIVRGCAFVRARDSVEMQTIDFIFFVGYKAMYKLGGGCIMGTEKSESHNLLLSGQYNLEIHF